MKLYTIRFCALFSFLLLGACGATTTDLGCIWFQKTHWTNEQISQTTTDGSIHPEWRSKYEQDAANNRSYDQHCLNK